MNTLVEICNHILSIEEGMLCGTVEFTCDNLASAMKCGHPADILDEMLARIFFDIMDGIEPGREKVEILLKDLKRFKRSFKVKELAQPIKDLTNYLNK